MTGSIIFDAVLIFFIAYAILNIFYELSDYLTEKFSKCKPKHCLVLLTQHNDSGLECRLRMALAASCRQKCGLVIVTEGLNAEEEAILWRLTENNRSVFLVPKEALSETVLQLLSLPQ